MALIDRIKYDGPPPSSDGEQTPWLIYKFPSEELVTGAQLIVNQSQKAILYKDGVAFDVFGPGRHTLSTSNLPLLKKVINLPYGGQTPFTAEVYYINETSKLDLKWGTSSPFQMTDPKYQVLVRVRAYGQFGVRIRDPRNFVTQLVGTLHNEQISDHKMVTDYFKGLVLTKVKDTIADMIVNGSTSLLDITASLDSISQSCQGRIEDEFDHFGLEIVNFFVESINVPEDDIAKLREILEKRAEFDILGDERYSRKRTFDVLEETASNEGVAGSGMQLGTGLGAGAAAGGAMGDVARQEMNTSSPPESKEFVQCPNCNTENSHEAKFCNECGSKLETESVACPECQSNNSASSKFCSNCGTSLTKPSCPECGSTNSVGSKFCSECGQNL